MKQIVTQDQNTYILSLEHIVDEYRQGRIEEDRIKREYKNPQNVVHTPQEIHNEAVMKVACDLIENGISTKTGSGSGIDLVLDNGNTIAIRGASKKDGAIPLIQVIMGNLVASHIVIITGIWENKPSFYVLNKSEAEKISDKKYYKRDGTNSWFIRLDDYRYYKNNYEILGE